MTRIDTALDTVSRTCNEAQGHTRLSNTQLLNQPQSYAHKFAPQPTESIFRHPNQVSIASSVELDSLVKRVQIAVGDEIPRTPVHLFSIRFLIVVSKDHKIKRRSLPASPIEPLESFHCGEMSVASKQYLQKYGLLSNSGAHNSPLRRHSPPYKGTTFEANTSRKGPSNNNYSSLLDNYYNNQKRERREEECDENILDMENLRRLPKLT